MPEYIYRHPEKEEYVSVIQTMSEKHCYFDKDGVEWCRVLTSPKLSTSSNNSIDPFDQNSFINKASEMKGNYGDLVDQSRELSDKRAAIHGGEDPIKRKHLDKWSKDRGGRVHPQDKAKRVVENKNIRIDY